MYSVYKITNIANGKLYIGITKNKISVRWSQHKSDAKRGSECPIHRAIRKYGNASFAVEEIETNLSGAEAFLKEKEFISSLRSNKSHKGYNASSGGESGKTGTTPWCKGKNKNTSSVLMEYSVRQTGIGNTFFGKTHTEGQKKKWSRERKGVKRSPRPDLSDSNKNRVWTQQAKSAISKANSRSIICLNTGIVYSSIVVACKTLNLDPKSVWNVLKGNFKQTKGYSFKYALKE